VTKKKSNVKKTNFFNTFKFKRKTKTKKGRIWQNFKHSLIFAFRKSGPENSRFNIFQSKLDYKRKIILKSFLLRGTKYCSVSSLDLIKKVLKFKLLNMLSLIVFKLDSLLVRLHFAWDCLKSRWLIKNNKVSLNNRNVTKVNYVVKINDKVKLFLPYFKKRVYILKYLLSKQMKFMVKNLNWIEFFPKNFSCIILKKPYFREILTSFLRFKVTSFWLNARVLSILINNFY
jgi:ribosomal protein S4